MISDRPYMRREYPRERTSATVWLVAILVSAYGLELLLAAGWVAGGTDQINALTLTIRSLQLGHWWTLLTHALVHDTAAPFGFVLSVLGIVLVGRELEPQIGARKMFGVFAGATLLGALSWSAVHATHGGVHFGTTAGWLGLFVALTCLYPDQEVNFLAFFVIPVTVRPRYFVYAWVVLDVAGLLAFEVSGGTGPLGFTPSAQLGGMAAGWMFFRFFHAHDGWDRASAFRWPAWLRRARTTSRAIKAPPAELGLTARDIRTEVDRILDKINSDGFGALTEAEKRLLDEAKDLLSKH